MRKNFATYIFCLTLIVVVVIGCFGCSDNRVGSANNPIVVAANEDAVDGNDTFIVRGIFVDTPHIKDWAVLCKNAKLDTRRIHGSPILRNDKDSIVIKLNEIISLLKQIKNKK